MLDENSNNCQSCFGKKKLDSCKKHAVVCCNPSSAQNQLFTLFKQYVTQDRVSVSGVAVAEFVLAEDSW